MLPLAIILSASHTDVERINAALAGWAQPFAIDRLAELNGALARRPHVIVVGVRLRDQAPAEAVRAIAANPGGPRVVRLRDATRVDDPHAFHVADRDLPVEQLRAVLAAAVAGRPIAEPRAPSPTTVEDAQRARRAFEASRRLATQQDLAAAEAEIIARVAELVDADRAACLFHDADSGALWSEARLAAHGDERRASDGLAGFSARTGMSAVAARADADRRYARAIDDPTGRGDERVVAQPVVVGATVHAVLVAVRPAGRAMFGAHDAAQLAAFAELVGPLLVQLSAQVAAGAVIADADGNLLFRPEAIAARKAQRLGEVLRLRPLWVHWGYAGLVLMTLAGGVFVAIGRVGTYSAGPAVVRTQARSEITAPSGGSVRAVAVAPGHAVAAGDLLVQLDDTQERAEVDRLTGAFEAQVRNRMLAPAADATGEAVAGLRLELDRAQARAEQRQVRAPAEGTVGEIRIRPGQPVATGEPLLSLVDARGGYEVLAFLPGGDRPQLTAGMTLRLRLAGFPQAHEDLVIAAISDEIVGPAEAARYLGPQLADSLSLGGPVVIVHARIPDDGFTADGKRYQWHDGLGGRAEVRVKSESILATVIPGGDAR